MKYTFLSVALVAVTCVFASPMPTTSSVASAQVEIFEDLSALASTGTHTLTRRDYCSKKNKDCSKLCRNPVDSKNMKLCGKHCGGMIQTPKCKDLKKAFKKQQKQREKDLHRQWKDYHHHKSKEYPEENHHPRYDQAVGRPANWD